MSLYRSNARMERVDRHWQATDAVLCGDITLGEDCSFWFQSVIRGDVAPIRLGQRVNVQEQCVLHCDSGKPLEIGDDCTIGHGAIVHCSKVGARCLIGMNAVILGECVIGNECVIGAGAVVSPGTVIPDGQVVVGVPAKIVRAVREKDLAFIRENCRHYVELAREHVEQAAKFYR
jgi:carbonic anhydrase/acetyltransferase-like protein (isoleucine patch superfamily)